MITYTGADTFEVGSDRERELRAQFSDFLSRYTYIRAKHEAEDAVADDSMLHWHTLPMKASDLSGGQARAFVDMFDIALQDIPRYLASTVSIEDIVRSSLGHPRSVEDEVNFCRVILTWRLAEETLNAPL